MPPQIRASTTSSVASEKRSKCRGGIGTPSSDRPETTSNSTLSLPKKSVIAPSTAPVTQLWPDGWSGKGGVPSGGVVCVAEENSDSQLGSGTVAGFPSLPASRIAARGRQNCQ